MLGNLQFFSEHGRLKRINEGQENRQGLILLLERILKNYFGNPNKADAQGSAQQQHSMTSYREKPVLPGKTYHRGCRNGTDSSHQRVCSRKRYYFMVGR